MRLCVVTPVTPGRCWGALNHLIRCDCTTRNRVKAAGIQAAMDELELRIAELAEEARRAAERPGMDGAAVMAHLDIGPGRHVGEALAHLLELKREEGELERPETRGTPRRLVGRP